MPSISYYKNVKQTESKETIAFDLFLDAVRSGKWQDDVFKIRLIQDKDQRRSAKALMPNVTISGQFGKREDKDCKLHSGFIAIDLDDLMGEVEATKQLLASDPYLYAAFVSVSGTGLCLVFRIDPERHRDAFEGLADYLIKKYQVIADPTGVNPSRTRFVSYDPYIYIANTSLVFKKYLAKPKARKITATIFVQDEFDRVVQDMVHANVSCVEDYRDWRDIAFGLADQFGEAGRGYFHSLSSCSSKYESSMCDRQYTHALKRNGRGGNKITIATIYWHAKQAGINVASERTKRIAAATSTMKKSGLDANAIATNLAKFEGIFGADDIIKQAFAANASFAAGESLVENIRMWLRHNFNLKRNVVTRKIENDGRVLEDVDFNTMYLDCKILFDTLNFELFMRVIYSRNTADYNPIRELIDSVEWDGERRLDQLGACITSNTGTLEWRCYMVRKWVLGIVTAVYGGTNELNLVLVGGKYTGKTEFFKRLLPPELLPYFALSQLNRGKDDEILMCEKLLILNDEYGGKNRMDERNEKRLMAADKFDLRVPYGKGNETIRRMASLGGTCNELGVLDDDTGNRRIIVIEAIGKFDYTLYNSLDKYQLLAEALVAFRSGERPELRDADILTLETTTDGAYSKVSIEGEMLQKYFQAPEFADYSDFMTATEIKIKLEYYMGGRGSLNVNKIGSQLKKLKYVRKKLHRGYGYEIREITQGNYNTVTPSPTQIVDTPPF